MNATTTTPRHTSKESAAMLRQALREAFPRVKFSARMSRGTGHGWVDVSWMDGPTVEQVREVAEPFQGSAFDGMDDSYHSTGTGHGLRGILYQRDASPERVDEAAALIVRPEGDDVFIETPEGWRFRPPYANFDEREFATLYARTF